MKKLILLLFATLLSSAAFAITPPSYTFRAVGPYLGTVTYGNSAQTAVEAGIHVECAELIRITTGPGLREEYLGTGYYYPNYSAKCPFDQYRLDTGAKVYTGEKTTAKWSVTQGVYTGACPANSTLQGGSCVCNSGYVEESGQCVQPQDPCSNTEGLTTGYTRLEVQFSNVNPSPSALGSFVGQTVKTAVPINGNSCAATGQVESCALAGTTLYCILTGSTYTGATYNGEQSLFGLPQIDPNATPENELPKVCPEGQYAGEVNGTQVCVKANGSANTTQSTTTNPDGTSTTTTTTTACVGDKCTSTTTTETKDAQGNTTGTGTSKVEGDKDAFCMANPQVPECKNTKSNFGGTCDAAFTCESEDAVMCAIALDQYKTNCELLKRDENLGQNLADLIDMPLTDLDLDTTTIQAPQASGSSCSITPFSIPVGIGAFTVDLTHMCAYLSIIKAIVTAFGFVMWTLIVFVRQ